MLHEIIENIIILTILSTLRCYKHTLIIKELNINEI